jgi:hypothetical protein
MSEDEAKTKWCPFARAALGWEVRAGQDETLAATVNRGSGISDPCRCIASECMAWRWTLEREEFATIDTPKRLASTTDGHCGLAGPAP